MSVKFFLLCQALLLLFTLPAYSSDSAAPAELLKQAREYMAAEQPDAAYRLLVAREFEYAGDTAFDYLLGVAALDSGRFQDATFVLERVTISEPDFAGARLDLARAYFELGSDSNAINEFQGVLAVDPPSAIVQVVEDYLAVIAQRRMLLAGDWRTRLALTLGFDTNVNTAPAVENIVGLGDISFTLSPDSRQQEAGYGQLTVETSYLRTLTRQWQGFAAGSLKHKQVAGFSAYDNSDVLLQTGAQRHMGKHTLALGLQGGRYYLAHDLNYIYYGPYANWQYAYRRDRSLSLFVRQMGVSYSAQVDKLNDFKQWLGGLGSVWENPRYTLWLSGYAGLERAFHVSNPDGDRKLLGLALNVGLPLGRNLIARANLGYQRKRYRQVNPIFDSLREEHYYTAGMELEWPLQRNSGLVMKYSYMQNDSNFAIYDYERHNIALTVYRHFQ